METKIKSSQEELTQMEIRGFVNEGLQDVYNDNLLDFHTTFQELEKRYSTNE